MPRETIPGLSPEQKQIQKEREGFEEEIRAQIKKEKGVIKGIFTSKKEVIDKIHEIALKEKEEREIEQVTFDEVLKETWRGGVRTLKTNDEINSELLNLLKARIINNNEAQKLLEGDFPGRGGARSHLMRLLAKGNILGLERQGGFSNAEHNFVHAFLEYGKKIGTEADQNNEINLSVIGQDTKNTCKWWTHAPYVYETLLERGIESEEAFRKTLLWGNLKNPNYDDLLGLEELEKLDQEGSGDYILSANPQGASHRFAKKMARKVVDEILKIEQMASAFFEKMPTEQFIQPDQAEREPFQEKLFPELRTVADIKKLQAQGETYVAEVLAADGKRIFQRLEEVDPEGVSYFDYRKPKIEQIKKFWTEDSRVVWLVGPSKSGTTSSVAGGGGDSFNFGRKGTLLNEEGVAFTTMSDIMSLDLQKFEQALEKRLKSLNLTEKTILILDEFPAQEEYKESYQWLKKILVAYPQLKVLLIHGGRKSNENKKQAIRKDVMEFLKECPIVEIGHKTFNKKQLAEFKNEWVKWQERTLASSNYSLEELHYKKNWQEILNQNWLIIEGLQKKYPILPVVISQIKEQLSEEELSSQNIEDLISDPLRGPLAQANIFPCKEVIIENRRAQ